MSLPEKILVCDDQPMNVKLLARSLKLFGYEVLTATHGEEAIAIAKESNPDIILLDVMMPNLSGYDTTKILKKDPMTKAIPIVLITALSDNEDKLKGLQAGADDFLTKPVNQTELLTRVRSLVRLKKLYDQLNTGKTVLMPSGITSNVETADTAQGEKHIILIIEDDAKETRLIESHFYAGGYETIVANNASEAIAILKEAIPDLILLDILLPDMDGIVLLVTLRSMPEIRFTPIIIISALGDLDTKVKSFDTGADDYIVKPINPVELMARIKSNLIKYGFQKRLMAMADNYKATIDNLFKQSIIDSLTGLNNRHFLKTAMDKEMESSRRYDHESCVLMMDIDFFKSINDTYGHITGDSVLKELGTLIKQAIRTIDTAIRYGGEEFLLILTHTGMWEAARLAERIRSAVANHRFSDIEGGKITVSIGLTQFQPADSDMLALIKRADDALYKAKEGGRNRVVQG